MIESIERMRKLVNDNLVMGLRFQMNGELNKLEQEIEQELNSRAERTCHIVKNSLEAEHEPTNGTCPDTPLADLLRELRQYENGVRYDYDPFDDIFEPDERLSELCGQVADMLRQANDVKQHDSDISAGSVDANDAKELQDAFNQVCKSANVPTDWKPIFAAGAVSGVIEGTHKLAIELQAQVDKLTVRAVSAEEEAEDVTAIVDRLRAERDNLAADLAACERDRESYRDKLGAAIDHAHEILTLVDMDGEVVS